MPKGKSKPQAGTRLPRLRGVLMVDEVNGKPRTRAWPKPRGPNRNATNQYWSGWLKAVTYLWRYQPAKFQAQLIEATRGTPWMPRDPFISAARGRAWSFTLQDGRTYYPMPVVQAVSQSLDAIAQLAGSMLYRTANRWEPIPPPGGAGKVLISTGDNTVPTWQTGGGGGASFLAWSPISPPATANPDDEEFDNPGSGPPSGWTLFDPSGALTVAVDAAGLVLVKPSAASVSWGAITRPIPSGNLTLWTHWSALGQRINFMHSGLLFFEDPTDPTKRIESFTLRYNGGATNFERNRWNNWNSFNSGSSIAGSLDATTTSMWCRVRRNATTYTVELSNDGRGWARVFIGSLWFTPTAIGLGVSNENQGIDVAARYDFLRWVNSDIGQTGLSEGRRV